MGPGTFEFLDAIRTIALIST